MIHPLAGAARWRRIVRFSLGAPALAGLAGCQVCRTVAAPVKLAAKTVVVAGDTAGAVVTNGGRLAVSGANAVGGVGSAGIDSAAKLARAEMVTFFDASDGKVVRVPWREGLALSGAASAGQVRLAGRALELVRAGKVVWSARHGGVDQAVVAPGDVVRLMK